VKTIPSASKPVKYAQRPKFSNAGGLVPKTKATPAFEPSIRPQPSPPSKA
jgi:hypothetical protein